MWNHHRRCEFPYDCNKHQWNSVMGRYALLWMIGVPLPILVLIWFFGGLH
jgi:hypothetical protein